MNTRLGVELDSDVNALYRRIEQGTVARAIEISPEILVDVDENGTTLGVEFVDADDVIPYLRAHGGSLPLNPRWDEPRKIAV